MEASRSEASNGEPSDQGKKQAAVEQGGDNFFLIQKIYLKYFLANT